ncbi:uncharacterized protein SEPMUDRAFT_134259 [Sphaerulina musiva SO2202]|uniref:Uncharacterized protein n=1 Tax=Sphaerulina musiva (strain SO2202) TaxID=692275 RepID=M3D0I0_SPHMS|nr:uncharacterized protein SEPMUDRAFT_134259 [Sphaerulina musiva SO2202]EMF11028.1 hypothetical protein SEPMUDRAFT_134259 [Sphaerulina musiva SO2202]
MFDKFADPGLTRYSYREGFCRRHTPGQPLCLEASACLCAGSTGDSYSTRAFIGCGELQRY